MIHEHPHRLLLAVDGSTNANRAADYLAHYAAIFGVREILVLFVQSAPDLTIQLLPPSESSTDVAEVGKRAAATACQVLEAAKLPYALDTEVGDPADVIIRAADTERVDEIVMGVRGTGRWSGRGVPASGERSFARSRYPVRYAYRPWACSRQHSTSGRGTPLHPHRHGNAWAASRYRAHPRLGGLHSASPGSASGYVGEVTSSWALSSARLRCHFAPGLLSG